MNPLSRDRAWLDTACLDTSILPLALYAAAGPWFAHSATDHLEERWPR